MDAKTFLSRVSSLAYRGVEPFAPARIEVIADISRRILAEPIGRSQPQFVALGYWMRRSAVARLKRKWLSEVSDPAEFPVSRGIALHLPPTNVDTIFVYSWALSFLAGNTNIVRLPSQRSETTEWLIDVILQAVREARLDEDHLFCAFDHGGSLLSEISRCCDLRLIWGGDAKVDAVSRLPLRPDGLSVGFPDRTSMTLIGTQAYLERDVAERDRLAAALFNDIFWFDQMGCGSPRTLFWIDDRGRDGMADLASRLHRVVEQRGYVADPSTAVAKMVTSYAMLAESQARQVMHYSNALDVAFLDDSAEPGAIKQGGGFLGTVTVTKMADIAKWVRRDTQTITHYGIGTEDLVTFAKSIGARGGYRLVPIGSALAFDETWDGIPLLTHMTRRIVVRT